MMSMRLRDALLRRSTQALRGSSRTFGSKSEMPAMLAPKLCDYLDGLDNKDVPVVELASPKDIRAAFAKAGIPIEVDAWQGPASPESLGKAVDLLLKYSVRTGSPLFFNQLYARADQVSIAADWVVAATNTNCHTFEVAPVYTIMEVEILTKIASIIGGDYANGHDGLFVPGGSLSNLYGMHLAHVRADPEVLNRGAAGGPRLVAFTSDQSHYSYLKSAKLTCLGRDNLIEVPTDGKGAMIPEAFEEAVLKAKAEGATPFFCGATAGTTVLGGYDPFDKLAEICKRHDMWMHIDACWGGGAMLSEKHGYNMKGAELADSLAWNPHKMSGATLQTSAFLTRHAGILAKTNGTSAAYLFQPDKLNTEYDIGDKTIQCGRKNDMFKLWLMWKAKGDEGMRATIDHCFDLAEYMATEMRNDPSGAWELVYEPSCTNVCFWYVPKKLRPFKFETATEDQIAAINKVAPIIKNEMQKIGDALIGFQAVNGKPNFFRQVYASADSVSKEDIKALMGRMAEIGERLAGDVSA